MTEDVVIVGAGLAGLACALRLKERGIRARIFEGSDRVGGRVATDRQEGFLLDRGFQVLLTAYPMASQLLDYGRLGLADFHAGAKVQTGGKLHTLGDPARHPGDALPTLLAPVATLADKARVVLLRNRVTRGGLDRLLARKENTTRHRLASYGFSEKMTNQFFRPFLGGIFLENELVTSSRKFEFVFRMFSLGSAAIPSDGMGAIPKQLAEPLGIEQIVLNREVAAIEHGALQLMDGRRVEARKIVLACDPWSTAKLLGEKTVSPARPIACLYFAADVAPVKGPWLVLNGDGSGPVNNLCVPSEVQTSYAPQGQSLISVSVIDPIAAADGELETAVRTQLTGWFGQQVAQWRHVRTYRIEKPIPLQIPPALELLARESRVKDGLYRCGDAGWIASIEGALRSGWQVGQEIEL